MESISNAENGFLLLRKYRNFLMGFAALCILFFHTWHRVLENTSLWFFEDFFKTIGFFGADMFFFLSGFGLLFSIRSHSVLNFYYHRFRNLAIPVLIAGLLNYAVKGWTVWQLLRNVSGINFYTISIYSFLWFVPAIATLYLLFPVYYKLFSASSNKTAFTLYILVIWLFTSITLSDNLRIDMYGFTNRIPIFCVGCLAGYLSQQGTYIFNRSIWILLILTLILGLYLSYLTNYRSMELLVPIPNCCVPNFLITVSVSLLIPKGMELLHNIPVLKSTGNVLVRFFSFFGKISLELYCIQEWLFELINPWLSQHFNAFIRNIIFFISVTALSVILWLLQKTVWNLAASLFSVLQKKPE